MKHVIRLIILVFCFFFIYETLSQTLRLNDGQVEPNFKHEEQKTDQSHLGNDLFVVENIIGNPVTWLLEEYGEPNRIDPSRYAYDWYFYHDDQSLQQFAIKNEKIVSVFLTGINEVVAPYQLGMSYQDAAALHVFKDEIAFGSFTFQLTDEDLLQHPLIKLNDNTFVQLYFDTFTEKLSAIRVMDQETILAHQPYTLYYYGQLPKAPQISDDQRQLIDVAEQYYIYQYTNVIRNRHQLTSLDWGDAITEVAFEHSKDMEINQYFSHTSADGRELGERLNDGDVTFVRAGENIAAQYIDGLAAVEGWLNSEGHRKALLDEQFTHIGVGTYKQYYTQNFITVR
ncbi:Uncharacterized conserved protein YkwD, contains CAP (CSP/antigen 5/PR1) domain [Amphibacillus marinus]|uniref:Uncharacterized conserved protein YkwD, contains CAP (CSP/antigen 5/PR1) domain n=1 Tax=Amphibacillus marinus TaxID=872970 RepID=A0A1H8I8D9_9BACI|nr:CAP domain-containing protein [Amphibacillus marinus]SEN64306.1 Uncharacterized conserved protein YkwD, contains CAP (CSP/antigen 5/PR1) domain [Amphibacillus marinus]